jgi:hypothetical protein
MRAALMMMVFLPMAKRHRTKRVVQCPETDQPAEIVVDNDPWYRFRRMGATIRNCSLWPKRKGCTQTCLNQAPAAGSEQPARSRRSSR